MAHKSNTPLLRAITTDTYFFAKLILDPSIRKIIPCISLPLLPWTSAFVFESSRELQIWNAMGALDDTEHLESLIEQSRYRSKMFSRSKESLDQSIGQLELIQRSHFQSFQSLHNGPLRRLKRYIQPDLGISYIESDIIGTTHVSQFNTGISTTNVANIHSVLGEQLLESGIRMGQYVRFIATLLNIEVDKEESSSHSQSEIPSVTYRDVTARSLYASILESKDEKVMSLGMLLLIFLSQVNVARILLPKISPEYKDSVDRIQFLTVYHVHNCVSRLLRMDHSTNTLTPSLRSAFSNVAQTPTVKRVGRNTTLRNALMHYSIDVGSTTINPATATISDIYEHLCRGNDSKTIRQDTIQAMDAISSTLASLVPKYKLPPQRLC